MSNLPEGLTNFTPKFASPSESQQTVAGGPVFAPLPLLYVFPHAATEAPFGRPVGARSTIAQATGLAARRVDAIVAEPTTRVPSYRTIA